MKLTCFSLFAIATLGSCARDPKLIVNTTLGPIQGVTVNGIKTWQGIPFAEPPTGRNRFRPPQLAKPWTNVVETIDYGATCPQLGMKGIGRYSGHAAWTTLNITNVSEDCLFANVYVPAAATEPLPVVIYLHAGEFRFGAAADRESTAPFGNGTTILVTANARLGYFGFAALDQLRENDPHGSTGNYGIQDQRLLMQWVQASIARFGGDPSRVTIMGESSGGASVAMHITSKFSKGLFQRAILESPGITQSKSWNNSLENTQFAISSLTSGGGFGCAWNKDKTVNQQYVKFLGCGAYRGNFLGTQPLEQAISSCDTTDKCMLYVDHKNGSASFYQGGVAGFFSYNAIAIYNVSQRTGGDTSDVYMKIGDPAAALDCLYNASVDDLVVISMSPPHSDTFNTDAMAPTVDGVELTAPLPELVRKTSVTVDVLGGGNMDEGTEFMSLSPPIACDASYEDFQEFCRIQFGAALGVKVTELYKSVQQPIPICDQKNAGVSASDSSDLYWAAAMRSVGDEAIICRTRDLMIRAFNETAKVNAWWYYFTITPLFSENMPDLPSMGAFHGSEIPFVFGDQFELGSDGERQISRAMGCYWSNFAATGNPNQGSCVAQLNLPAWPSVGANGDVIVFKNTTIETEPMFKKTICDTFAQFP